MEKNKEYEYCKELYTHTHTHTLLIYYVYISLSLSCLYIEIVVIVYVIVGSEFSQQLNYVFMNFAEDTQIDTFAQLFPIAFSLVQVPVSCYSRSANKI